MKLPGCPLTVPQSSCICPGAHVTLLLIQIHVLLSDLLLPASCWSPYTSLSEMINDTNLIRNVNINVFCLSMWLNERVILLFSLNQIYLFYWLETNTVLCSGLGRTSRTSFPLFYRIFQSTSDMLGRRLRQREQTSLRDFWKLKCRFWKNSEMTRWLYVEVHLRWTWYIAPFEGEKKIRKKKGRDTGSLPSFSIIHLRIGIITRFILR